MLRNSRVDVGDEVPASRLEATYEEFLAGIDDVRVPPVWPQCYKCNEPVDRIEACNWVLSSSQTYTFFHHGEQQRIRMANVKRQKHPRSHLEGIFWHTVFLTNDAELDW